MDNRLSTCFHCHICNKNLRKYDEHGRTIFEEEEVKAEEDNNPTPAFRDQIDYISIYLNKSFDNDQ